MKTLDHTNETVSQDDVTASVKRKYDAPEIRIVGSAATLVQGCGGGAGQDRNYYRIYC